jgi:hypothetical protein
MRGRASQQVRIHRPSSNPDQRIFNFSIERLSRLAAWPAGQRARPNPFFLQT